MPRRGAAAAATALAIGLWAAPAAEGAPRTGRADDGTRFTLDSARASVQLGKDLRVRRGARVQVRCGRTGEALRRTGSATKRLRSGRRVAVRLSRDVGAVAEWCQLRVGSGREFDELSAVQLDRPQVPPPAPLAPGPGVRVAESGGDSDREAPGSATFLQRGPVLTVVLDEPLGRDGLLFLSAFGGRRAGELNRYGYRRAAVRAGQTSVTVDLERDAAPATLGLVEDDRTGDLFTATF